MRIRIFGAFFLAFIFASVGCASKYQREEKWLNGTIQSVRIVTSLKEKVDTGNPVLGAAVGGMVAEVSGAVVGSALGSGNSQIQTKGEIVGCRFVVKLDGEATVAFTYPYNFEYGLSQCITLREADRIKIAKIIDKSGGAAYWWRVDPYNHPEGEVIPN